MDSRTAFEALTRALGLDAVAPGETVLHGTLVLRSSREGGTPDRSPASDAPTRAMPGSAGDRAATLPRLDVGHDDEAPGAELTLGELLGAGGMGAVYTARQRSLRRDVAIKRLREGSDTSRAVFALLSEARTVGALEHPNIVPVHVLGRDEDGTPILVMKRIEGASLAQLLSDPEHPAWAELERRHGDREAATCEILMRVADGLHFAHSRGYLHRDVKPANIMVGSFGEVYLVDWGVALAPGASSDDAHEIVGTPAFMAPEMVYGDPGRVDARTDVYLLGATLHNVLTGSPRHKGDTGARVLFAAMTSAPVTYGEGVPEELAALASAATAADPSARPPSAAAFRDRLADFLRHRSSQRMATAAEERLDALRPAEDVAPDAKILATPETFAILSECRFALTQALAEWKNNERARRALRTTLLWMVEAELERRSADGARTIARAIEPAEPSIAPRIAALERALEESRMLEEEGRAEREERDLTKTSRWRVPLTVGLIVLCVAIFIRAVLIEEMSGRALPMDRVVNFDVAMIGIMASVMWVTRKRLLTNRLSRQLASLLLLAQSAATIADQVHASRGETSTEAGALSIMMIGGVFLGAAIGIGGRLWYAAGVCFASGIVAAIWPWTSTTMVGVGIIGCLAALVYDGLGPRSRVSG